jgi:sugar porter (SP) family MFS transporter
MFTAACFSVVGGALQAGSVDVAMFIVARLISGFGIGMIVMLVPLWQCEVAPPHARGLLVGLHGVSINIGYTSSTWIGVGFFYVNANGAQWRVPLAIQCLAPLILACGIFFIPESPRWLIDNDKAEKAREVLYRIHRDPKDPDNTFAHHEYSQIKRQLAFEHSLPSSWTSLFTIAHYRKRAIIGFLTMFAGQMTGTLVINNYGPELYASLGYGSADQLIIAGGWITVALFGNAFNSYFLDRLGRTRFLAIGLTGDAIALLGETIMLALFQNTTNKGGLGTAVFFLYLHVAFYGFCIDASTYVYGSEIWPTHLRAKGFAVSIAGLFTGSLILLVSAPTAFANIGWM